MPFVLTHVIISVKTFFQKVTSSAFPFFTYFTATNNGTALKFCMLNAGIGIYLYNTFFYNFLVLHFIDIFKEIINSGVKNIQDNHLAERSVAYFFPFFVCVLLYSCPHFIYGLSNICRYLQKMAKHT